MPPPIAPILYSVITSKNGCLGSGNPKHSRVIATLTYFPYTNIAEYPESYAWYSYEAKVFAGEKFRPFLLEIHFDGGRQEGSLSVELKGEGLAITACENVERVEPVDRRNQLERTAQVELSLRFKWGEVLYGGKLSSMIDPNAVRLHGRGELHSVSHIQCESDILPLPLTPQPTPRPPSPTPSWLRATPPPPELTHMIARPSPMEATPPALASPLFSSPLHTILAVGVLIGFPVFLIIVLRRRRYGHLDSDEYDDYEGRPRRSSLRKGGGSPPRSLRGAPRRGIKNGKDRKRGRGGKQTEDDNDSVISDTYDSIILP